MLTRELEYELPPGLIARFPADRRDASRLLVIDRTTGRLRHAHFHDLPELLPDGALLVMNDTRVLPARLEMRRESGGRVEGLFLSEESGGRWRMMMTGSARLRPGKVLRVGDGPQGMRLIERVEAGTWLVMPEPGGEAVALLERYGLMPLPPYIRHARAEQQASADAEAADVGTVSGAGGGSVKAVDDRARYQTVYASAPGAVAAPTAGLHFTDELLDRMRAKGIETVMVTLHVGVGTFAPIRCDDLREHEMHAEWYACGEATSKSVNAAREEGRAVIAVGTTSARVLESIADESGRVTAGSGWTNIFICPPYRFRSIDGMVTNFHLPSSTLLAMVMAFAGCDLIQRAYAEAIREKYRFYSYGDATLML